MKMKKNQKKEEGDKSLFWRMSLLILSSSIFTTMVLIISSVTMRSGHQDLVGRHNNIHGGQAGHHDEDGGNRSSCDGDDQQRLKLVPVRFYLKQHNLDWLEQRLYEISDPDHTDYGQWFTLEELSSHLTSTAPVAPSSLEDEEEKSAYNTGGMIDQVLHWLKDTSSAGGAEADLDTFNYELSPTKDSMLVYCDVETIETVFGTTNASTTEEDPVGRNRALISQLRTDVASERVITSFPPEISSLRLWIGAAQTTFSFALVSS